MQRPKQSAFTLVELIVVITILAILGTIAFISLQGYSATSRDSVRIADVGSMSTALEIFQVNSGKYPLPDNGGFFTYLGDPLWTQGNFGENVVKNLSRNFSKAPTDPLSDKEYIYSRAGNGNEFQLLNLLEGDIVLNTISQTNAVESVRTPKVGGTYNGLYIKTKSYLVPLPSIITSLDFNEGDTSEISGTGILSQVITGGTNVPKYGNAKSGTGGITGLQLSVADIVTSESTPTEKATAMQKIQDAYSGSSLEKDGIYEYILSVSGEDNLADLLETVVLNNATAVVSTTPIDSEAPTGGSFSMSGSTSSTSIDLSITCPEEDGVEIYISGTGLDTGGNEWVFCETTKSIVLTSGDGIKNITMKFRDNLDNRTNEVNNTIILDTWTCPIGAICGSNYAEFKTSGNYNFLSPSNNIIVYLIGAGGGGRTCDGNQSSPNGIWGGGGGAFAKKTLTNTLGINYSLVLGQGGTQSIDGGNTSFDNIFTAGGGKKGEWGLLINNKGVCSGVYDLCYEGGNGGYGSNNGGAGGGCSGSSNGIGTDGKYDGWAGTGGQNTISCITSGGTQGGINIYTGNGTQHAISPLNYINGGGGGGATYGNQNSGNGASPGGGGSGVGDYCPAGGSSGSGGNGYIRIEW